MEEEEEGVEEDEAEEDEDEEEKDEKKKKDEKKMGRQPAKPKRLRSVTGEKVQSPEQSPEPLYVDHESNLARDYVICE